MTLNAAYTMGTSVICLHTHEPLIEFCFYLYFFNFHYETICHVYIEKTLTAI